jgi:hypothetical protein
MKESLKRIWIANHELPQLKRKSRIETERVKNINESEKSEDSHDDHAKPRTDRDRCRLNKITDETDDEKNEDD